MFVYPSSAATEIEPRDRELLAKLHATQSAAYELVQRMALLRRTRPSEVAAVVKQQLAKADAAIVGFHAGGGLVAHVPDF